MSIHQYVFTAPAYQVYIGYIVFVFSFFMSVCVCFCVNLFFVKDFSGTIIPRILKFGANIEYVLLYCVRENQHHAYHSLYLYIFLSFQ